MVLRSADLICSTRRALPLFVDRQAVEAVTACVIRFQPTPQTAR